jgi:hypothetical protein
VLRSRQSAELRAGTSPAAAFVDGYHAGLMLTIALTLAGVVVSYLALRRYATRPVAQEELATASGTLETPIPAGDSA